MTHSDHFQSILQSINPLPREYVPVASAHGRVLAQAIKPRVSLPEFDVAVADGYAVRCADIDVSPVTLAVQGESNSAKAFQGRLDFGKAVKTYAGGKIADGADALVPLSRVSEKDGYVVIEARPAEGEKICHAGVDFSIDDEVLKPGTVINSRIAGLASIMQLHWLPVVRKPRVAILAVGSELAFPGQSTTAQPVTASSLYTLPANVTASGADPIVLGLASDAVLTIIEHIDNAKGCDLLITTGGTSAGAGNLMQHAIQRIDPNPTILRTQLRRNDLMLFSHHNGMPICSLPGNPTSCSIYFTLFVRPIINKMVGICDEIKKLAILGRTLDEQDASMSYLHASLSIGGNGTYQATPLSAQDGFLLSELAKSDCLIVVNERKGLKKGDEVEYIPLSHGISTR